MEIQEPELRTNNFSRKLFTTLMIAFVPVLLIAFQNCAPGGSSGGNNNQGGVSVPVVMRDLSYYKSFDVAEDGRVFGAYGGMYTADRTRVGCFASGAKTTSINLVLNEASDSEGAVVKTNRKGDHVAVLSRTFSKNGDYNSRVYQLWFLDGNCRVTAGPIQFPGPSEYRNFDIDEDGNVALGVGANLLGLSFYYYRADGSLVFSKTFSKPESSIQHLFTVNLNTGGEVLLTWQGHSCNTIFFKRLTITDSNSVNETNWKPVFEDPQSTCMSSWYESHAVGFNSQNEFVVEWTDYKAKQMKANFFAADATLVKSVIVENVQLADPSYNLIDTFRDLGKLFKIAEYNGNFILATHFEKVNYGTEYALYSPTGNLVGKGKPVLPAGKIPDSREIAFDKNGLAYSSPVNETGLYTWPFNF